ncbi:transcriptional repressor [Lachnospiraceae bacterium 48-42]|nr:ferric uptake regulator family protein [Dorea sp.]
MSKEENLEKAISQLKSEGYRITGQRKLLLGLIFGNEYSSCKEIYFAAKRIDSRVGMATVYRTVQLLEDMGLLRKRWSYELKGSDGKGEL